MIDTAKTTVHYTHQHPEFDALLLHTYTLNLMVHGSTLSMSIYDKSGKILAIKELKSEEPIQPENFKACILSEQLLSSRFAKVIWVSTHPRFLLCPAEYLRYEEAENLFAPLRDSWDLPGVLKQEPIEGMTAVVLHEVDTEWQEVLSPLFIGLEYKHLITRTLYQANRSHQATQPVVTMSIYAMDGHFVLHILNRTGPVLSQIFRAVTAEDYLYYSLWACQQLNIAPEHVSLTLSGQFHTPTPVMEMLKPTFPTVNYLQGVNQLPWYHPETRVPVLHYLALLPEIA